MAYLQTFCVYASFCHKNISLVSHLFQWIFTLAKPGRFLCRENFEYGMKNEKNDDSFDIIITNKTLCNLFCYRGFYLNTAKSSYFCSDRPRGSPGRTRTCDILVTVSPDISTRSGLSHHPISRMSGASRAYWLISSSLSLCTFSLTYISFGELRSGLSWLSL